jgi:hypothetical protein
LKALIVLNPLETPALVALVSVGYFIPCIDFTIPHKHV